MEYEKPPLTHSEFFHLEGEEYERAHDAWNKQRLEAFTTEDASDSDSMPALEEAAPPCGEMLAEAMRAWCEENERWGLIQAIENVLRHYTIDELRQFYDSLPRKG